MSKLEYLIERLETLSDEHLKEIADLSAQAFSGEVAWTTVIGGDMSLSTEYCNAVLRAAIAEGEVHVLKVERGGKMEIASWAGFFPPGRMLFGTEAQRDLGFNEFYKKLTPELRHWYSETYPRYIAEFSGKIFTKEEEKLHWWCCAIATRPDLQRNGFATALINVAYQKAKKTKELGTFLGLCTLTKNANTCTSMRFKEIGQKDCPLPGGGHMSTHVWIRKP